MRRIDRYAVLAQRPEQRPAVLAGTEPPDQFLPFSQGDIHRFGFTVDQVESLRNPPEWHKFPLHNCEDVLLVQSFRAFQVQQFLEIAPDGLLAVRLVIAVQRLTPRGHGQFEQRRLRGFALEYGDDALPNRTFPLPVAPARRLKDGIQSRLLPEHRGKVHIHSSLDQGGGYHLARQAVL